MTGNRDDATRQGAAHGDLLPVKWGSCLQRAHREMLDGTVLLVSFCTVVGATLIYSITGPLSIEDTVAVGTRLLYVGLCGLICWPLCHSLSTTILYVARRRKPHQIAVAAAAGAAFVALACSAVAYTIFGIAGKSYVGGLADIYLSVSLAVAACSAVVHYTACLRARLRSATEAVHAGEPEAPSQATAVTEADRTPLPDPGDRDVAEAPSGVEPSPTAFGQHQSGAETGPANAGRSRFLDRLPQNIGHDLIYLNVNGHYVNAVTTQGSAVMLMRLADAIAELDDMGTQVHRSYWVAHRHITAILRRDERTLVRVTGGHELPVSRTYLTAVRALIPRIRDPGTRQQIERPPGAPTSEPPPRV